MGTSTRKIRKWKWILLGASGMALCFIIGCLGAYLAGFIQAPEADKLLRHVETQPVVEPTPTLIPWSEIVLSDALLTAEDLTLGGEFSASDWQHKWEGHYWDDWAQDTSFSVEDKIGILWYLPSHSDSLIEFTENFYLTSTPRQATRMAASLQWNFGMPLVGSWHEAETRVRGVEVWMGQEESLDWGRWEIIMTLEEMVVWISGTTNRTTLVSDDLVDIAAAAIDRMRETRLP